MVYCDLIRQEETSATYQYSCGEGEPGIIIFPLKRRAAYTIEKDSDPKCGLLWINKLYARYIDDFLNGVAKEKISYEC